MVLIEKMVLVGDWFFGGFDDYFYYEYMEKQGKLFEQWIFVYFGIICIFFQSVWFMLRVIQFYQELIINFYMGLFYGNWWWGIRFLIQK